MEKSALAPTNLPRPTRRWLQFRIRSLLLVVFIVACGLGWLVAERAKVAKRTATVHSRIWDFGAQPKWRVWLLGNDPGRYATTIDAWEFDDTAAEQLAGCVHVKRLYLNGTPITDHGIEHIARLRELTTLDLSVAAVTDASLERLAGLPQLDSLWLDETAVTDTGVEHLVILRGLKFLSINETRVSAACARSLVERMPSLNYLAHSEYHFDRSKKNPHWPRTNPR